MTSSASFSLAAFSAQVGTSFTLADSPSLALELTAATPLDAQHPHDSQFSLILHGPLQPALEQAIYTFTHAQMAALTMFIVPIGRDATGMSYQAVFN
ncbi:hypothetical protein AB2N08_08070 [Massilia aurea]|uniref:DUF6916 family protein n=1 Tax=Massilia aurea TaxID=373040 RepID=UPI003461DD97